LGQTSQELWEKGFGTQILTATVVRPGTSVLVGAGYEHGFVPDGLMLPQHLFSLGLRLDRSGLTAGARLGYGTTRQEFEAWAFQAHALLGEMRAGYGWDLGRMRMTAGAFVGLARLWQEYDDGQTRTGWLFRPGVTLGLLYPTDGRVAVEFLLDTGLCLAPGAGAESDNLWRGFAALGLSVFLRFD
jgi:hypothetical protein